MTINPNYDIGGADLSYWTGSIKWDIIMNSTSFLLLRAGNGQYAVNTTMEDQRYREYYSAMQRYNMPWGAYWYYVHTKDPVMQADKFWNIVRRIPPLPLFIDLEDKTGATTREIVTKNVLAFLERLDDLSGDRRLTGLYTRAEWWNSMIDTTQLSKFNVNRRIKWVANYLQNTEVATVKLPRQIPSGWPRWDIWQFSADRPANYRAAEFGVMGCKSIDLNVWNGNISDFSMKLGVMPKTTITMPGAVLPKQVMVDAMTINMRDKADEKSNASGTLKKGYVFDLKGIEKDGTGRPWAKIDVGGKELFIAFWLCKPV